MTCMMHTMSDPEIHMHSQYLSRTETLIKLKVETFVWILNHISRSITLSLFTLKASYLVDDQSQIVQSLNSPFFPPPIGAEPRRAERESKITCMYMLRTPPFFFPQIGGKTIFGSSSRFRLWRDYTSNNFCIHIA